MHALARNERVRARPVGIKLELTYACNLRCGFCYTDSPRHTLARTPELGDDDVLRIADEAIELGTIEAVVTGGEPLLRRELALEVIERFARAGLQVALNTNGWFVDEAVAGRVACAGPVRAHVSLDGATAALHEASRGVPGSWARAARAVALFAERDVPVQVVHVVTPDNQHAAGDMVQLAWLLGAESLVLVTVVPIGAAARGGRWQVDARRLARAVEQARARAAPDLPVRIHSEIDTSSPARPPSTVLVRPDGSVRTDSINPFVFGHALRDGLATCWERIVADWDHPRVRAWREPLVRGRTGIADAELVPYRDEDMPVDAPAEPVIVDRAPPLPAPAAATQGMDSDPERARAEIVRLALARRYRLGAVRVNDDGARGRLVRVGSQGVARLNAAAALVMDACTDGTPAEATERLAARHPDVPRADLEQAAIGTARRLAARGILCGVR